MTEEEGVWLVWFAIDHLEAVCHTESEAEAARARLADRYPAEYLEIEYRAFEKDPS